MCKVQSSTQQLLENLRAASVLMLQCPPVLQCYNDTGSGVRVGSDAGLDGDTCQWVGVKRQLFRKEVVNLFV